MSTMSKKVATLALAVAMTAGTMVPVADAGKRGHHYRGDHHHHSYDRRHHRRGYYKDGKWIALGILGAAVGAAIADRHDRDCYYRHGRRYCDY